MERKAVPVTVPLASIFGAHAGLSGLHALLLASLRLPSPSPSSSSSSASSREESKEIGVLLLG
eukprot:994375-Rhodomonas_salina.1